MVSMYSFSQSFTPPRRPSRLSIFSTFFGSGDVDFVRVSATQIKAIVIDRLGKPIDQDRDVVIPFDPATFF